MRGHLQYRIYHEKITEEEEEDDEEEARFRLYAHTHRLSCRGQNISVFVLIANRTFFPVLRLDSTKQYSFLTYSDPQLGVLHPLRKMCVPVCFLVSGRCIWVFTVEQRYLLKLRTTLSFKTPHNVIFQNSAQRYLSKLRTTLSFKTPTTLSFKSPHNVIF